MKIKSAILAKKFKILIFSKIFRFSNILKCLKNNFLHDEIIFSIRFYFYDQVGTSSIPINHLQHSECRQGGSGRREETKLS